VPKTGTATYSGQVEGAVFMPVAVGSGSLLCNCAGTLISGNASFTANFGTHNLAGTLTGMTAPHPWYEGETVPWNDVAFEATITGNAFSGSTSVTTSPTELWSLGANATGTIEGKFFGPAAQEAGAVWTLFDGVNSAIGTIAAKLPGQ
jgi:hypothetical protein